MPSHGRSVHTLQQISHLADIATAPARRAHTASSAVGQTGSIFRQAYILPNPLTCSERQSNQRCGVAVGDVLACRDTTVQWVGADPRTLPPHRRVQLPAETRTPPWHFQATRCL